MKAYKGFNKDMTCRGFQFEEGKTYEEDRADLCKCGFHACEAPLDVFRYYAPATSVFREVELEDVSDARESNDTKVCGKRITIGAELDIRGLVNAHVEWVKAHTNTVNTDPLYATVGDRGVVTVGDLGSAMAGDSGAATAGIYGAATAGDRGAATAGYSGAATAGDRGAATSRGASSVGANGLAVARGNGVKVRGGLGSVLVICEENEDDSDIREWKAVVVDGKAIKEDTWYKLKNGELVKA